MSSTQQLPAPQAGVAEALASYELCPLEDMWWLTPAELESQFEQATPGDTIVYGVGQLDYACGLKRKNAQDIWAATGRLFRQGKATLTKKNLGPGKSEYWLVKR